MTKHSYSNSIVTFWLVVVVLRGSFVLTVVCCTTGTIASISGTSTFSSAASASTAAFVTTTATVTSGSIKKQHCCNSQPTTTTTTTTTGTTSIRKEKIELTLQSTLQQKKQTPISSSVSSSSSSSPLFLSSNTSSNTKMSSSLTSTEIDNTNNNKIINGKDIAKQIRGEMKDKVTLLKKEYNVVPGLAVILVGNRTDSATYVRMKRKACDDCNILSELYTYPDDVTQDDIIKKIQELNTRHDIHGILIQLPLPKHINEHLILNTVIPDKDVDGLTSTNIANLCNTSTHSGTCKLNWKNMEDIPFHIPCTPQGCIELLDRTGVSLEGKNCVIIGRSNLVGLPVSMLLMHRNATITIVHSKTQNISNICSKGDIVIAAVGRTEIVKSHWIKQDAVVIDVGINTKDDPTSKKGYKLVGDVDYDDCLSKVSKITPVPGGVGPMTIAMLLRNTYNQCYRSIVQ